MLSLSFSHGHHKQINPEKYTRELDSFRNINILDYLLKGSMARKWNLTAKRTK